MVDVIQIGFQKSATTFLEWAVYKPHPNINIVQAASTENLQAEILNLIFEHQSAFDFSRCRDRLDKAFAPHWDENALINGFMYEGLTFMYTRRHDPHESIRRLRLCYPQAKIIMSIRRQDTWILSHYSQYLKSGGTTAFGEFFNHIMHSPFGDARYLEFDRILAESLSGPDAERLFVLPIEDLFQELGGVERLYRFLGVTSYSPSALRVNPSLTTTSMRLRRAFNYLYRYDLGGDAYAFERNRHSMRDGKASPAQWAYWLFKHRLTQLLYTFDARLHLDGKLTLTPDQQTTIESRFSESNERLGALLGRDLGALGYP